jgi:hypothetical protein
VLEYLQANIDLALQRPEFRDQLMEHLCAVTEFTAVPALSESAAAVSAVSCELDTVG